MPEFTTTYPQNTNVVKGTNPVDEVQTLTVTGTPTGGTFKLTFNGSETGTIAYNAAAAAVQTALEALDNVPPGSIVASGGALPGASVVLTFADVWGDQDVSPITVTSKAFTGGTSPNAAIVETTKGTSGQYDVQYPANPRVDARATSGLVDTPRDDQTPNQIKP